MEMGAALSRMTFTHELAHQFGCKHSPGNKNGSCEPDFERPYEFHCGGFLNNKLRITLMEAGVKKKNRIPHFSNPEATYEGHATGRFSEPNGVAETNNARQLREQTCEVAGFRSSNDLSSVISGLIQLCDWQLNTPKQWIANVMGGSPGAYSYSWQISINNGVTYGSVLSTSDNLTLDVEDFEVGDFFVIRLTVIASNSETIYDFQTVEIVDCEDPHGRVASGKEGLSLQLAPNPANDFICTHLRLPEKSPVTVTLLDASGVAIRTLEQTTLDAGETGFNWKIESLPAGMYQIQVATQGSVTLQKVAIIH
ncbi:MAG: T9SS type A sorting domain-containing protein [Lewinellaceae bacterium]|nr:T9SS type A sorting domain-containing protein [Lewinellaceae bacterium]